MTSAAHISRIPALGIDSRNISPFRSVSPGRESNITCSVPVVDFLFASLQKISQQLRFRATLFSKAASPSPHVAPLRESWAGIEPAHVGFANRSVTTSPPGQVFRNYFTTNLCSVFPSLNLSDNLVHMLAVAFSSIDLE